MAGNIIYETKASLHFLKVWQLVGFGKKVQVTPSEIRVEGRVPIPLSSVTTCELKYRVTRFAHVRLGCLGDDGTPKFLRFFPSGLQWGYREPEFASRLYAAIIEAGEAFHRPHP